MSCATVPMEVGAPCFITLLAALNTYAADRIRPPPETALQPQQSLKAWRDFDGAAVASGAFDIVSAGQLVR